MRDARMRSDDETGQMTVELCVFLPIAIIIATIVMNAMIFFGDCAEFDRLARNAIRVHAASPSYHQTRGDSVDLIRDQIESAFEGRAGDCDVSVSSDFRGFDTYKASITFDPTLFGMRLRNEIFGVRLPKLSHTTSLTVSAYKPGMIF